MSVICHNFVQNAWKKDLCSNCFKFVGDHKRGGISPLPVQNGGRDRARPSAPSNGSQEATAITPHTTWKNLIAEKNSKNGSPFFKLENGFQGRLLTINKALNNGTDNRQSDERRIQPSEIGIQKGEDQQHHAVPNGQSNGLSSIRENRQTVHADDGQKKGSTEASNNQKTNNNTYEEKKSSPTKGDRPQSEEVPLQGILKKKTENNGTCVPARRGVGFKDEEPLVIGYGGRDFGPEELEWEAASSDEGEGGSDSLDESEDDVFSNATRKNTEFNSDNLNLVQNEISTGARRSASAEDPASSPFGPEEEAKRAPHTERGDDGSEKTSREEEDSSVVEKKISQGVAEVKNSLEFPESFPLPSVGEDARSGKMFSEREGIAWREEEDEESGTQDGSDILQAINTSLTQRHAMHLEEGANDGGVEGSGDGGREEKAARVQPRESFLHGPSAIYGPASDLFVPRSNSSSSSSSDEQGEGKRRGISLSINVRVNGTSLHQTAEEEDTDDDEDRSDSCPEINCETERTTGHPKTKPDIPAKPKKRLSSSKCDGDNSSVKATPAKKDEERVSYRSSVPDGSTSPVHLVDPYAECNIYQEVNLEERGTAAKMESKLAALAVELEQARHVGGSTKRQAPAPPKVPDPPQEDPPSCSSPPQGFSSFRGESSTGLLSSASSTTSSSSQDTEAGYASWNLHGEEEDNRAKHPFSKSSFLLQQYSRCKMMAMDRKKFSIKKLLKIGKDSADPDSKAWKHLEGRPRARLEIIHPMDLENKSAMVVNPGFEGSSFSPASSSDYGSYYSDTLSPCGPDVRQESCYDYVRPEDNEESKAGTSNSTSPTPSRSSTVSQASTVTSGSSKNEALTSHRPPKPPPPPRAHSLLPGNKASRNSDGNFRLPSMNGDASSSDEVTAVLLKPQAPKRQCKSAVVQSDYTNYDDQKNLKQKDNICDQVEESISTVQIAPNEINQENDINDTFTKNLSSELTEVSPNSNEDVQISVSTEGVYDNLEAANIQTSITVKTGSLHQADKGPKSILLRSQHPPLAKAPARPIYSKPQPGNFQKYPWKTLEDSYLALTFSNRELLIKLVNQALKRRENCSSKLIRFPFHWADFEMDASQPSSVFAFGEKIACHATMPRYPEHTYTLVISIQQQTHVQENNEIKYPLFGKFNDYIPRELLDGSGDSELESMPATVLVMDRSNIVTIEYFSESLPESLLEENEKELCFITLQLIQSLKSLQVQGIESIDTNCQNLLLAKTKNDRHHTLVFLYDPCYEESDYASDSCKISLCQYTLLLLFQMLKIQSVNDNTLVSKFSSSMSQRVFEMAFSLLSEEKAVSLSQTKTLFECYLWGVTKILENVQKLDDCDAILQRWLDIERSNCVKTLINDEDSGELTVQNEYHSQFLIRTSVRNIREVASYLLRD